MQRVTSVLRRRTCCWALSFVTYCSDVRVSGPLRPGQLLATSSGSSSLADQPSVISYGVAPLLVIDLVKAVVAGLVLPAS